MLMLWKAWLDVKIPFSNAEINGDLSGDCPLGVLMQLSYMVSILVLLHHHQH
jgi:hypothetical protein